MSERVVVIGHGAREHALAHKLAYGEGCSERTVRDVIVIGGNAGIAREFECVSQQEPSLDGVVQLCKKIAPDLVVIGPENYLADGIKDRLEAINCATFGPHQAAAQLEASKYFAKNICHAANITTADGAQFNELDAAKRYVEQHGQESLVIKADGLCAGKGVSVCTTKQDAIAVLNDLYRNGGFARLGTADTSIVIEEFCPALRYRYSA